jgi:hypothetical protein
MDLKFLSEYGQFVEFTGSRGTNDGETTLVVDICMSDSNAQPTEHWCYLVKCDKDIQQKLRAIDGCNIIEIIEGGCGHRNVEPTQKHTEHNNFAHAVWDYLKNNVKEDDGHAVLTPNELKCLHQQHNLIIITINEPIV